MRNALPSHTVQAIRGQIARLKLEAAAAAGAYGGAVVIEGPATDTDGVEEDEETEGDEENTEENEGGEFDHHLEDGSDDEGCMRPTAQPVGGVLLSSS
jgi:hypothetical protein